MVEAPSVSEEQLPPSPDRDEAGNLSDAFLNRVRTAIAADDAEGIAALAGELHEADLAELIESLGPEERSALITLLGDAFDYTTLTELDEATRLAILDALPAEAIAEGVRELDSDDAVYILEDLDEDEQEEILAQIPAVERLALKRSLDYPEESAGRRMQTEFIAVPPFWTVGQTIDYLRRDQQLPDEFHEIFVVDPGFHLLGSVGLNRLLRNQRSVSVSDIMDEGTHLIPADLDQEEAARTFERYNLVAAGVVDEAERLVGVLTIDDIVDVIHEEAAEDIRLLAGVGAEEVSDSIRATLRSRFPWLLVNLVTAVLASVVIAFFDATIQQMVALAVLMPIVASMGGNATTQTMTVAVRALATRQLRTRNLFRVIYRETVVGLLNGVLFAVIIGAVAALWFSNAQLGGVIAAAMIVNMLVAGASGILVPIGLNRLGVDPAIASGVFVTTVTDIVGFLAFLGLAAWWFGLA